MAGDGTKMAGVWVTSSSLVSLAMWVMNYHGIYGHGAPLLVLFIQLHQIALLLRAQTQVALLTRLAPFQQQRGDDHSLNYF